MRRRREPSGPGSSGAPWWKVASACSTRVRSASQCVARISVRAPCGVRGSIQIAPSGAARSRTGLPARRCSAVSSRPSAACASSGCSPPPSSMSATPCSHCIRAGARRLRSGAFGSSTRPPPTVRVAWALRTMYRSPGIAHTGSSNTSCTQPDWPGASASADSGTTCATCRAAPMCTCSGVQARSGASAEGSSVKATSTWRDGRKQRASAIQSPRVIALLSIPARFRAQRWPAAPVSLGWFCAWMPRTRTRVPAGIRRRSASSSPARARPPCAVPVTTVPWPASVKTRSTANRNRPAPSRAPSACAASSRCCLSRATPASPARAAHTSNRGASCRNVAAANAAISPRTAASRAASARSALVNATAPRATPSSARIARCSRVCGMTPSSAATTSRPKSMPLAPAAMVCTSFSWPGTSMKPSTSPLGRGV
ncbi:Uncharacterised protein [Achromobacter xylosoxidans]|nr:Uncharacterised protein [Achromobacter xylosoxidans]